MIVVGDAPLVDDDVGTPARKRARIELDFIGKEDVPLVRQGDHATKTVPIVIRIEASGRGSQAVRRGRDR